MSYRFHHSTRPEGLDRLRRVTAGVAVTSAIATGGFGILAAATFRGHADATTVPDQTGATTNQSGSDGSGQTVPGATQRQPQPNATTPDDSSGGFVPIVPRHSSGRGHVSTGGSG
jgi:hypothetical protein